MLCYLYTLLWDFVTKNNHILRRERRIWLFLVTKSHKNVYRKSLHQNIELHFAAQASNRTILCREITQCVCMCGACTKILNCILQRKRRIGQFCVTKLHKCVHVWCLHQNIELSNTFCCVRVCKISFTHIFMWASL